MSDNQKSSAEKPDEKAKEAAKSNEPSKPADAKPAQAQTGRKLP